MTRAKIQIHERTGIQTRDKEHKTNPERGKAHRLHAKGDSGGLEAGGYTIKKGAKTESGLSE